jgi:hypothetical protein
MRKALALPIVALVLVPLATPSIAVTEYRYRHRHHPTARARHWPRYAPARNYPPGSMYGVYGNPYSEAPAGSAACVPWCNADLNPCDPPYFKEMDGRCSGAWKF